jgi:hypothetical protein
MRSPLVSPVSDTAKRSRAWPTKSRPPSKWNPVRFSGRIKFRKSKTISSSHTDLQTDDSENGETTGMCGGKNGLPGCGHQFHNYCQHTSLHGFRYITEKKRSINER